MYLDRIHLHFLPPIPSRLLSNTHPSQLMFSFFSCPYANRFGVKYKGISNQSTEKSNFPSPSILECILKIFTLICL